jgi:hypothetical protein
MRNQFPLKTAPMVAVAVGVKCKDVVFDVVV